MDFQIRNAAEECRIAFKRCLAYNDSEQVSIRSAQGNFNLWCVELEVTNPDDSCTLDYRLRKTAEVRNLILYFLKNLRDALNNHERLKSTGTRTTDARGARSRFNSTDAIKEYCEAASGERKSKFPDWTYGNGDGGPSGLAALDPGIFVNLLKQSYSVPQDGRHTYRFQEADDEFDGTKMDAFRQHLTAEILRNYADSNSKKLQETVHIEKLIESKTLSTIQERLVRANLLRRNRIQWNIKHRSSKPRVADAAWEDTPAMKRKFATPAYSNTHDETSSRITDFVSHAPLQKIQEIAMVLVSGQTTIDRDSQLKVVSTKTQTTTIEARQAYPETPTPSPDGSIQCSYCFKDLSLKFLDPDDTHIWRAHIDHDLVPYSCIAKVCDTPDEMYLSSDELLAHMMVSHSVERWTCDYCTFNISNRSSQEQENMALKFDTEAQWQSHIAQEHQNIVPAESRDVFAELNKRAMIGPLECPLCSYVTNYMDTKIDSHILQHLQEFALRSLSDCAKVRVEVNSDIPKASEAISSKKSLSTDDRNTLSVPTIPPQGVEKTSNQQWKALENIEDSTEASQELQKTTPAATEQMRLGPPKNIALKISRLHEWNISQKILVAIDFGLEYSAIAWASTDKPVKINVVDCWGSGVRTANKAPTALSYHNDGSTETLKWGFQAKRDMQKDHKLHEWFKLGLCTEQEKRLVAASKLNRMYPISTTLPSADEVYSYERLVTDYLTSLRRHVLEQLESIDKQIVSQIPRKYIITVPTVWSDKEQDRIRDCAEKAGMGKGAKLQLIPENEAAAIWALDRTLRLKCEVGETFIICNVGQRTADLSSYTVESLEPGIQLVTASKSTYELCGSIYLDQLFAKYLQERMEGYTGGWDQEYFKSAAKMFESTIKVKFTGHDNDDHSIYMPSLMESQRHRVEDGSLVLTGKELREYVFNPVITRIQQLVEDQIVNTSEPVKRVLLAGTLGQNAYLKDQLQSLSLLQHEGISVERLGHSDTEIVQGAVMAGLTRHVQIQRAGTQLPSQ